MPYTSISGLEHIDKVIDINQSPIGRTPRSNPATYTGVFGEIRALFAKTPEAAIRGYKPGRFSFNVKGGRCETCQGGGLRVIEMNFLPAPGKSPAQSRDPLFSITAPRIIGIPH